MKAVKAFTVHFGTKYTWDTSWVLSSTSSLSRCWSFWVSNQIKRDKSDLPLRPLSSSFTLLHFSHSRVIQFASTRRKTQMCADLQHWFRYEEKMYLTVIWNYKWTQAVVHYRKCSPCMPFMNDRTAPCFWQASSSQVCKVVSESVRPRILLITLLGQMNGTVPQANNKTGRLATLYVTS